MTAGEVTVNSTGQYVFDDPNGATSVVVTVASGSTQDALVNVPGLHADGEFFRIVKGASQTFQLNHLGIRKVFIKGNGGNATVYFGIASKTYAV